MSYLYFTSFHQCTVELLSGPLCICTRLKCYKTKSLRAEMRGKWGVRGRPTKNRCLASADLIFLDLFNLNHFTILPTSYLGSPLIENDLHIEDFAKLLQRKKRRKMKRLNKSCTAYCHRVSALFNHDHQALGQICYFFFPSSKFSSAAHCTDIFFFLTNSRAEFYA